MADHNAALMDDLEKRFALIAGEDGAIDRDEFKKALGLRDDFIADRQFTMVGDDSSGEINWDEFLAFVQTLIDGDEAAHLNFAFRLHNPYDSGDIDQAELEQLLKSSVAQHGLEIPETAIAGLAAALFHNVDTDQSGDISFEEFSAVLEAYPNLKRQLTFSAAGWLRPPPPPRPKARTKNTVQEIGRWIANNKLSVSFLILYAAANVWLFVNAVETYAAQGAIIYV